MDDRFRAPLGLGWTLWPEMVLRGAGFAARQVLMLAAPDSAAAADRYAEAESALAHARARAAEACGGRLAKRILSGGPLGEVPEALRAHVAPLEEAGARFESERARLEAQLAQDHARVGAALRRAAEDPRFLEALTWQNRGLIRSGVEPLRRHPAGSTDSKTRQKEAAVASYLQRYCTKNDTIGFFGPVGWARAVPDGPPLAIAPGETLVDRRTVYFEHWAIDALAQALAADEALRRALPPRRMPGVRVEETVVHFPVGKRAEVGAAVARALLLADGERPAGEIVRELVADESLELGDEDEAWQLLDELAAKQLMSWTIEIATHGPFPERRLRRALEHAGEAGARGLAVLEELESLRARVAEAPDATALAGALDTLDEAFRRVTDREVLRGEGQVAGGRMRVYLDCRRALAVALGPGFTARLGRPLALLGESARWYTHEVASGYRAALEALHTDLGGGTIDFLRFRERAMALFPAANRGEPPPFVAEAARRLRLRWSEVLALREQDQRAERTADHLEPRVREAFAAPGPGWPEARFVQPDVMVAADGPDAFRRGDFTIVLGELHFAKAAVLNFMFTKEHPHPELLLAERARDIPDGGVWPVEPKQHAVPRSDYAPLGPCDRHLETGATRSWLPRTQVLAAGELVVAREARGLEVRTRDGAQRFDAVAFFQQQITAAACLTHFGVVPPWPHAPRVSIDGVVVSRERWRFSPDALGFVREESPAARFAGARAWAARLSLPRFVFVKVPEEPKPTYVDLESPILVELLAKQARGAHELAVTEMLPNLDETWVVDRDGERYTAELRMVAVDPLAWRAP